MKGNKPDFHDAMTSELSKPMYDEFLKIMRSQYKPEAIKGMSAEDYYYNDVNVMCRWRIWSIHAGSHTK